MLAKYQVFNRLFRETINASHPPNNARFDLYQHTGPFGDKREEQLADIRLPPYNQKHDET